MGIITFTLGCNNDCTIDWEKGNKEILFKCHAIKQTYLNGRNRMAEIGTHIHKTKFMGYFDEADFKAFAELRKCVTHATDPPIIYFINEHQDVAFLDFDTTSDTVWYGTNSVAKQYEFFFPYTNYWKDKRYTDDSVYSRAVGQFHAFLEAVVPHLENWKIQKFEQPKDTRTSEQKAVEYANFLAGHTQMSYSAL